MKLHAMTPHSCTTNRLRHPGPATEPAQAGRRRRLFIVLGLTVGWTLSAASADQVVAFSNKKSAFPDNTARLVTFDNTWGADSGTAVHSFVGGATFVAALFYFPAGQRTLVPGSVSRFRTSTSLNFAGTWDAPVGGVTLPGVAAGTPVTLQVRVWDSAADSFENACRFGLGAGQSSQFHFQDPLLSGAFDQSMVNLQSFTLNCMPEPSVPLLAGLGCGGLALLSWVRRRR